MELSDCTSREGSRKNSYFKYPSASLSVCTGVCMYTGKHRRLRRRDQAPIKEVSRTRDACVVCVWRVQASPADGVVMVVGDVKAERVEQVKGATYSLRAFLGLMPTVTDPQKNTVRLLVPSSASRSANIVVRTPPRRTVTVRKASLVGLRFRHSADCSRDTSTLSLCVVFSLPTDS